ncbi:uncharacterized protein LOC103963283 isoform X1 [Pyrus x bretschneideri]|uniref:uncharacterized protein LOC103963283 isoform X1 n=1 Tax=Pyrus x bretschneideri TaxID=225117 RepID=UPI00202FBC9D|nr:uncharacterized protein LOC103963283 isoform X1 [Pyrus x bretschneideri]XP_048425030.1 uncharacterized protein LOC103963283 isoform X1 [Pyrus x bretschneideri]
MAEKKAALNEDLENVITLKALVDMGNNKVIFVESDGDFIDVIFSFLTMPMGRIVRLACKSSVPVEIGCMRNLYQSTVKFNKNKFRSMECILMLLLPCNAADCQCKNLKLKIDNDPTQYLLCANDCFLSYYTRIRCPSCGCLFSRGTDLPVDDTQVGGVFVKGQPRLIITDDLQVISPVSALSICLFSKLGVTDSKFTEELTFNMGVQEALNLLMHSFASKTPLTEILLKNEQIPSLGDVHSSQGISIHSQMHGDTIDEEEKNISLKLVVSKSKKIVCYAEAQEDFVNLLFSFLTLPLGFILEKMQNVSWKGCLGQLYKSVEDFDEQYLKSNFHKELLVNPMLAPGFRYEKTLLGIEETSFYYVGRKLTTDKSCIPDNTPAESVKLNVVDPKSHEDRDESAQGFLKGPATFTVTDNLVVRPLSLILEMSVLQELKVPFTDIEDHIVHVGKREALLLLVASFVGDSALTNTFIRGLREPKQEQ